MQTKLYKFSFWLFLGIFYSFSISAEKLTASVNYDELCKIYSEITNKDLDLSMKEMEITDRIQSEFPDYFQSTFTHIMRARADQRYSFIKQMADQQLNTDWSCEPMYRYYKEDFNE